MIINPFIKLRIYLQRRAELVKQGKIGDTQFPFVFEDGTVWKYDNCKFLIRGIAELNGVDLKRFTVGSQCFRIGMNTAMIQAGYPKAYIKAIGFWADNDHECWQIYTRPTMENILKISRKLMNDIQEKLSVNIEDDLKFDGLDDEDEE